MPIPLTQFRRIISSDFHLDNCIFSSLYRDYWFFPLNRVNFGSFSILFSHFPPLQSSYIYLDVHLSDINGWIHLYIYICTYLYMYIVPAHIFMFPLISTTTCFRPWYVCVIFYYAIDVVALAEKVKVFLWPSCRAVDVDGKNKALVLKVTPYQGRYLGNSTLKLLH